MRWWAVGVAHVDSVGHKDYMNHSNDLVRLGLVIAEGKDVEKKHYG